MLIKTGYPEEGHALSLHWLYSVVFFYVFNVCRGGTISGRHEDGSSKRQVWGPGFKIAGMQQGKESSAVLLFPCFLSLITHLQFISR